MLLHGDSSSEDEEEDGGGVGLQHDGSNGNGGAAGSASSAAAAVEEGSKPTAKAVPGSHEAAGRPGMAAPAQAPTGQQQQQEQQQCMQNRGGGDKGACGPAAAWLGCSGAAAAAAPAVNRAVGAGKPLGMARAASDANAAPADGPVAAAPAGSYSPWAPTPYSHGLGFLSPPPGRHPSLLLEGPRRPADTLTGLQLGLGLGSARLGRGLPLPAGGRSASLDCTAFTTARTAGPPAWAAGSSLMQPAAVAAAVPAEAWGHYHTPDLCPVTLPPEPLVPGHATGVGAGLPWSPALGAGSTVSPGAASQPHHTHIRTHHQPHYSLPGLPATAAAAWPPSPVMHGGNPSYTPQHPRADHESPPPVSMQVCACLHTSEQGAHPVPPQS